jgi:hypothetical protein
VNETSTENISVQLAGYLSASDEQISSELLSRLIAERVRPLSERIIRMKLGVSLRATDDRRINEDARDLVSEVKTLIVGKLTRLRIDADSGPIDNFDAYVRTVTINVCNQYLRCKYPNRLRLKNQLRYLLGHEPRFAVWQADTSGPLLCGLSEWKEKQLAGSADPSSIAQLNDNLERHFELRRVPPDQIKMGDLIMTVLTKAGRPIRLADLVSLIYQLRRIEERSEVTEDEMRPHNVLISVVDNATRLEDKDFLRRLWKEIGELPLRHRSALILNLKNKQGDGLITLLPMTRVATISEIARLLDFDPEQFARIWHELPWDDLAIAGHIGITRQQVINLRQSARATLRRKMEW